MYTQYECTCGEIQGKKIYIRCSRTVELQKIKNGKYLENAYYFTQKNVKGFEK